MQIYTEANDIFLLYPGFNLPNVIPAKLNLCNDSTLDPKYFTILFLVINLLV